MQYDPRIWTQYSVLEKMKKIIKIILETKLYPGTFLLRRIYVVLAGLPQKQICHNLKRPREEESKIIEDIGNKKNVLFNVRTWTFSLKMRNLTTWV